MQYVLHILQPWQDLEDLEDLVALVQSCSSSNILSEFRRDFSFKWWASQMRKFWPGNMNDGLRLGGMRKFLHILRALRFLQKP